MLHVERIPTPPPSVHATTVTGQQRRSLRKLIRGVLTVTGIAPNDLTATPRKAPQRNRDRLLYRRADRLTDKDLDALVREIGAARLMSALDRWTQPSMFSVAAE
jgi:hypothetical protein